MHYMSGWPTRRTAPSRKSQRFSPGSIEGKFYPHYVTHDGWHDSVRLFINSWDEVICAPGSLHILRINGRRTGRERERERERKEGRVRERERERDLRPHSRRIWTASGDPLFVHANRRRIRSNGRNSGDELSPLRKNNQCLLIEHRYHRYTGTNTLNQFVRQRNKLPQWHRFSRCLTLATFSWNTATRYVVFIGRSGGLCASVLAHKFLFPVGSSSLFRVMEKASMASRRYDSLGRQ